MTIQPTPTESLGGPFGHSIGRWWRRAKFQWLNADLLTDVSVAIVLFGVAFLATLALPKKPKRQASDADFVLAFFCSVPPLLMLGAFWYVRSYLKAESAYEDLRARNRPGLTRLFVTLLKFPCASVVLFSTLLAQRDRAERHVETGLP